MQSNVAMQLMTTVLPPDEPATEKEWLKARQHINDFIERFHDQSDVRYHDLTLTDLYLELIDIGYERLSRAISLPAGVDSVRLLDSNGYVLFTVTVVTHQL